MTDKNKEKDENFNEEEFEKLKAALERLRNFQQIFKDVDPLNLTLKHHPKNQ